MDTMSERVAAFMFTHREVWWTYVGVAEAMGLKASAASQCLRKLERCGTLASRRQKDVEHEGVQLAYRWKEDQ
jgi:predicted transcriptional regulator